MGAIFAVALAHVEDLDELPGERCALMAGAGKAIWEAAEGIAGGRAPRVRAHTRHRRARTLGHR